jgi:hypothetical protein
MYQPAHHFFLALCNARKAARRGDIREAERWARLAERFTTISRNLDALSQAEEARSQKRRVVRNPS